MDANKSCTANFTPTAIGTPTMTAVTTPTTGDTTTWSWSAVSCPGNTARYQYDYLIDSVSQAPAGWKTPTVPTATSINFTTVTEGHTYAVLVQAQCYNAVTSSAWSASSNTASWYHPITTYVLTTVAGAGGTVSAGGTYNTGTVQTITATPSTHYSFSSWTGSTGCSGVASHTITMDGNKTCTAGFTYAPPGSSTYTTPGTYTFTVPAGITVLSFSAIGAGGGGGGAGYGGYPCGGGGGGGGGRYASAVGVTPGQQISVVVGTGGAVGAGSNSTAVHGGNGSVGGNSSVASYIGYGGGGGGGAMGGSAPHAGAAGVGGSGASGAGSNGGAGSGSFNGGAGGGGNGGGAGGAGGWEGTYAQQFGQPGNSPGGGGGGGYVARSGGLGANGSVALSW